MLSSSQQAWGIFLVGFLASADLGSALGRSNVRNADRLGALVELSIHFDLLAFKLLCLVLSADGMSCR